MKSLTSKLAFVHRTLWQREPLYRWSALLGPPPAIGAAFAFLVVSALQPAAPDGSGKAVWAHWTRPLPEGRGPFAEATRPFPPEDGIGGYRGLVRGWLGETLPIMMDATQDVNVSGEVLTRFTLDQALIPLQRVVDAGPPSGLFIGGLRAWFVVPVAGEYAFSARLTRSGTLSADCLVRLGSARHRMLRDVDLGTDGSAVLNFPPTAFRLEPGLFEITLAVGCWRGPAVLGAGTMALIVRGPGETGLREARPNELLRPAPNSPARPAP